MVLGENPFVKVLAPKNPPKVPAAADFAPIKHQPKKNKPNPKRATFTVATMNDDFGTAKSNIGQVKKKADVVLIQEGKRANYRDRLGEKFGVTQNTTSEARAGSAITWNKDEAKGGKRGQAIGVLPHGRAMLARYLTFTDMKIDGVKVRMVAAHRPPARFKSLWPLFDRNLAAFAKKTKKEGLPMVIGMDANEKNPRRLAHLAGLRWHAPKGSIDGFLTSRDVKFEKARELRKNTSDHHPVVATFSIKKSKTRSS